MEKQDTAINRDGQGAERLHKSTATSQVQGGELSVLPLRLPRNEKKETVFYIYIHSSPFTERVARPDARQNLLKFAQALIGRC